MKRILSIVLAVLLLGGVTAVLLREAGADDDDGTATTTVYGMVGSEKSEFFADPEVIRELAGHGLTVRIDPVGSWAMEEAGLDGYDFAFPSSQGPADVLRERLGDTELPARPFYSPLVVMARASAAEVLAAGGIAELDGEHRGLLRMAPYLTAVEEGRTWQDLTGAEAHTELSGALYISSTDPLTSNSGAEYLAAASYVADGDRVADGAEAIERTAPLLRRLIQVQGAQRSSSDAPYRDFLSGIGNSLVLVYESQVAHLLLSGRQPPEDLVVLYPDTTVFSDHTVVPFTEAGKELGELLTNDPELRELAVRHGFRPQGSTAEFAAAVAGHTGYLNHDLTGVRQAPSPTSPVLRAMAERAREQEAGS
ncbi:substrate-binding domain-containing protein [Streptomyces aidingensis]|uniref:Extracellular solute-binding protein n=1 Tax=Streptomyces aidingensis TaxID=910347 RepID=A0A1I1K678_9ACTN|nr:substrate-binding domain-containing protein [Streptomyces aidingensis]SFC56354.1 extracellular solute-binding protein [Streptomyces aidingensis]